MASWTRAWRPAGLGRTASNALSTSLAEAEMALGSWPVSGAWNAPEGTSRELLDIVPHFMPLSGHLPPGQPVSQAHGGAFSPEARSFATAFTLDFGNISWVPPGLS